MANSLNTNKRYMVIKAAGDSVYGKFDSEGLLAFGPDVSLFVYKNGLYLSEAEARMAAAKAARAMPGNRYYVVQTIGGYMAHEPKLDSF